jgi:phage baseplate assembly protein gpV
VSVYLVEVSMWTVRRSLVWNGVRVPQGSQLPDRFASRTRLATLESQGKIVSDKWRRGMVPRERPVPADVSASALVAMMRDGSASAQRALTHEFRLDEPRTTVVAAAEKLLAWSDEFQLDAPEPELELELEPVPDTPADAGLVEDEPVAVEGVLQMSAEELAKLGAGGAGLSVDELAELDSLILAEAGDKDPTVG